MLRRSDSAGRFRGLDRTRLFSAWDTGWSFTGGPLKNASTFVNYISGGLPGTFGGFNKTGWTYTTKDYLSLANMTLPIPQQFAPLRPTPLDGSRSDDISAYSDSRPDPYIQNLNIEIQRQLTPNWSLDVAYIATKGTRLWGAIPLNAANIYAASGGQTFLDAYNITRAGGNVALSTRC